ncbi:hypothetical protein [Actinomadura sp. DC4]|uniref:hypothetical protein n=1 Tax=Actinomadura sp. DC4 TaxID=3055069 RepID=UPI0025AFFC38|nr:hypothetical protein [Actinomadura sp. DC4]MDN3352220.1 hypothetical protein [Actinomadura sp. DC4]
MSELRYGWDETYPDRRRIHEIRTRFLECGEYRRMCLQVEDLLHRATDADDARRDASRNTSVILKNLEIALDELRKDLKEGNRERAELIELGSMDILDVSIDALVWRRHEEFLDPLLTARLDHLTAELERYAGIRAKTSADGTNPLSLIETASNVVKDLLRRERGESREPETDSLFATLIEFIKVACIEILAAGLAAITVDDSPVTEMIKATIVVTATAVALRAAGTVKSWLSPPDLAPQLAKVIDTLDTQREELVVLLDALHSAGDASLLEVVRGQAVDIHGLAHAGHRLALLADWDDGLRGSYAEHCDDLADSVSALAMVDDRSDFSVFVDAAEALQRLTDFPLVLPSEVAMRASLFTRSDPEATAIPAAENSSAASSSSAIIREGTYWREQEPPTGGLRATEPFSST